jgi:hypothetical protein
MGYLDHSTALLILGEDIPGAPWSFHKWKEITGIQQGIFAANPSDLPVGLSSEDSKDIASYAKALHAKPEQDRKTFSTTGQGKDAYVGRYKMRKFLGKNWKSWGINDLIDAAFRESGVHPIELMIEDNTNVFPSASGNIDAALGSIAAKLFGEEWVLASGRAKAEVRDACKNIAGTNWWRLQKKIKRDHSRLNSLEKAATSALKSKDIIDFIRVI